MTEATFKIGEKKYVFEGEDLEDTLSSVKYSTIPLRLVRAMGLSWARKILWPTFSAMNRSGQEMTEVGLSLPTTLTEVLKKKTEGDLNASVEMNLSTEQFHASARGKFTSEGLRFSFESDFDEAESTGDAIRDIVDIVNTYNIDVSEIQFSVNDGDKPKQVLVDIDADVPKNLKKRAT